MWLYRLIFNGLKDKIMNVLHKVELEDKNLLHKEFTKDTGLKICYGNKDTYTEWLEHRLVRNLPIQLVSNPVCHICDTPYSFDKKKHIYTRECDC